MPANPTSVRAISRAKLAKLWGVSEKTISRISEKELPVVRLSGRRVAYRLEDVSAYMRRRTRVS